MILTTVTNEIECIIVIYYIYKSIMNNYSAGQRDRGKTKKKGPNYSDSRLAQLKNLLQLYWTRILSHDSREIYHQLIPSREELLTLFSNVLLPWSRGCFIRGSFMSRNAARN